MPLRFNALILCSFLALDARAQMQNPSYEIVSRCFFVYAPITELGRDLPHPQLFQFGQPRIGWVGGYVQANQNNREFKAAFESALAQNKRMAVRIERSLKEAIRSRNQALFTSIIDQAVACDRSLGIRTSYLPVM